jgi:ABC-type Na+ transport system ATPase subunit NatA
MANRLLAGHIEVAGSGESGVAAGSEILTVHALLIEETGAVVRQCVGQAVSALAVGGTDRGVICRARPKGSCVAAGRPVGVVRRGNLLHFPVSADRDFCPLFPCRSWAGTVTGAMGPAGRRRKGEARSSWRGTRLKRCARTVSRVDVISCESLTKRFGPTIAVNELDLAVSSGLVYGFLGPNGAGKTTTIRMLLGLIAPSAGQIRLLGRRLPDPLAVAQVGSMIEEPAFYPWMTGRVNLEVLGATGGGCAPGEVVRVLGLAGLSDVAARRVKEYSQGMRQRLGIAAAMLGRPSLLIVDEPTNGLDPAGIREIRGLLRGLAAEGTTVFLSPARRS